MSDRPDTKRRNGVMLVGIVAVVFGMVGLSFAAVPLYDLFCRVTGLGGTTQVADEMNDVVLDRTVRIRLAAVTDRDLPWEFRPEVNEVPLRVGEPGLVYYTAENTSEEPVAGTALYNVTPSKAGLYFVKVQCFCFEEQILAPGQQVRMPVYFYVDPAMDEDAGMDDVTTITLTYSFFRTESETLDDAIEEYYRGVEQADAEETAMLPE